MKLFLQRYFLGAFVIVTVLHLCAIVFHYEDGRFFTKPLLMPLLAVAVFTSATSLNRNIIIAALLFSFAGDCFLMFDYIYPSFFIFGLLSFLLTHVLYIFYFLKLKESNPSIFKTNIWLLVLVLGYGFALLYLLFPHLGSLTLPVIVYAIIICSMLLAALHIYNSVSKTTACFFVTGATLFVVSDSLLAINKFMHPFNLASFLIMLTYCAAQYFIVKGFLLNQKA